MTARIRRVAMTEPARDVLRRMIEQHGPVLLHRAGPCEDGSSPVCLPVRGFQAEPSDVLLGYLPWHTEFWIGGERTARWKHTHFTVDVAAGRGADSSLESGDGVRFVLRPRPLTEEENTVLAAAPPPRTGADPAG
ncbi:DUF779 domain-containing protein [Nocardia takedensis]